MRQFIVLGHETPTTPDFSLSALPGAGRLDLLARCVTAGLLLSHGIRDAVRVHLVLADEFTLRFDGGDIQGLHPDERSTAARIKTALEQREEAIGHMPVETAPGIELRRVGFEETLQSAVDGGVVCQLHEDGTPAADIEPPADPVFVLSDHGEFENEEETRLAEAREQRISLGPERLHADQAITVAHNWLDTGGFRRF